MTKRAVYQPWNRENDIEYTAGQMLGIVEEIRATEKRHNCLRIFNGKFQFISLIQHIETKLINIGLYDNNFYLFTNMKRI